MIDQTEAAGVISNRPVSEDVNGLARELDITLKSYGAQRYAYFRSNRHGKAPDIITNLPREWLSEYKEDNLHKVDPVLDFSKKTILPFSWATQGINKASNVRLASNAIRYRILKGHTFVSVSHGQDIGVLTICSSDDSNLDTKAHEANIQFALMTHHETYIKIEVSSKQLDNSGVIDRLSWREREVLAWTAEGKTYSETALILGISERTIKFHMSRIRDKLQVKSTRQAVFLASKYGLRVSRK